MPDEDLTLTANELEWLLREVKEADTQEHIPEDVMRTYLDLGTVEDVIEDHLHACTQCTMLANHILEERPPSAEDEEDLKRLKETILSYARPAVSMAAARQDANGSAQRLAEALEQLATLRQDMHDRLIGWRDQLVGGAALAEAAFRATIAEGQRKLEALPTLHHPSSEVAYAGAGRLGIRVRRSRVGKVIGRIVVSIDDQQIKITFNYWQASTQPLVVLVSEDENVKPRVPDYLDKIGNRWEAVFQQIPPGSYVIAIAPLSE